MLRRILSVEVGRPLSDWERKHTLSTEQYVSRVCMDTGTVFRINDSFMEVVDPTYFQRQNVALAALLSFIVLAAVISIWVSAVLFIEKWDEMDYLFLNSSFIVFFVAFGAMAIYFGRDVFFSLRRHPVRFARDLQKVYALLPGNASAGCEEVVCEVPWNDVNTIFCLHLGKDGAGQFLNIRCYKMGGDNRIIDGFSIGRRWEVGDIDIVLSQWNYWCMYMREGVKRLPPPPVYLSENENLSDSFFICMYVFGFSAPPLLRLAVMPMILLLLAARRLSVWTCRDPIWPVEITNGFQIMHMSFDEPQGSTPVGWKKTIEARSRGLYPENPHVIIGKRDN